MEDPGQSRRKGRFALPSFGDPNVARRAVVLHWVSLTVAVILVIIAGLNALADEDPTYRIAVSVVLLSVIGLTQWLLRRERVLAAAHLFTAMLWAILAVGVVVSGGTVSTSAPVLTAVTLIAGLVLGVRSALAYTGLSIAFLFGTFLLSDVLPESQMAYGPFAAFTTTTALLVFTAGILALGLRQLERANQRTREHQAAMLHSQRLESVGLLAGGVAHDFNNMLTVVLASAEAMKREGNLTPRATHNLDDIQDASHRAAELTRQLLAFGRKQEMHPRLVDLNDLVHQSERLLRHVVGERVTLELDLERELPFVYADPLQISQVIVNLVVNARDALDGAGTVTIRTARERLDPPRARRLELSGADEHVLLEVTDTGAGIPPDILDRVFDPFFTTKPQGRGTGLGLSSALGIVKQSEGAIEVLSEPGAGTTMRVFLRERAPALKPDAEPARRVEIEAAVREALASHEARGAEADD